MDIHPLVVHFPIAFLTIYALLECLPSKRLRQLPSWSVLKLVLLVIGTGGALMALLTGDIASELSSPSQLVVEKHETFATLTTAIFGFLSAVYIVYGLQLTTWHGVIVRSRLGKVWGVISRIALACMSGAVTVPLALTGLVTVTITGALGGLMVYGPKVDPFVGWVAKIFFPNGF